ncbi:hypothetical protein BpHYR1_039009 [Brachionus plicatilis]|uniref:Uncharacterized protein n=1 Tax=Brachionus plicatilis TaxID=10195 RepID=A0A3M7T1J0_BRAPC|nr:hypothetical protein BpHYR1_039009 [Brachionus plicatilis]
MNRNVRDLYTEIEEAQDARQIFAAMKKGIDQGIFDENQFRRNNTELYEAYLRYINDDEQRNVFQESRIPTQCSGIMSSDRMNFGISGTDIGLFGVFYDFIFGKTPEINLNDYKRQLSEYLRKKYKF